jgi:phosphoribosylanthranilate isomerase
MKVKICGLTNLEDARAAVGLGADLLGFNFYPPSPRYISPPDAAQIIRELRHQDQSTRMVGVFVNETPAQIRAVLEMCSLDFAQLSGDEFQEVLALFGGRAFKALRPTTQESALSLAEQFANPHNQPALLFDTNVPGEYGGTGKTAAWNVASAVAERYPILLAGGLTPENLAQAVQAVQPWGVDVASGVEFTPGKKDPQKMARFMDIARNCWSGGSR